MTRRNRLHNVLFEQILLFRPTLMLQTNLVQQVKVSLDLNRFLNLMTWRLFDSQSNRGRTRRIAFIRKLLLLTERKLLSLNISLSFRRAQPLIITNLQISIQKNHLALHVLNSSLPCCNHRSGVRFAFLAETEHTCVLVLCIGDVVLRGGDGPHELGGGQVEPDFLGGVVRALRTLEDGFSIVEVQRPGILELGVGL